MSKFWPILLVIAAVVIFRLIGPLAGGTVGSVLTNVSPLAAVIVAGAVYLPRRAAWWVPGGALFISTAVVNLAHGWPIVNAYTFGVLLCFAAVFALAWTGRGTRRISHVFALSLSGTLLFYLLSNTLSWLFEPGYAKSLPGWWQAQTTGLPLPGAPPSWWFLLKSLAGDLLFTAVMVLVCHPRPQAAPAARPATSSQPAPA